MANRDRLSGLDAAFLHLESGGAHMHVAAVFVFDGAAPPYEELVQAIAARLLVVPLDRTKPLWEMNLVEGLAPGPDGAERFAVISKTHHALVDGVSGVDITSVLFDTSPDPAGRPA